MASSSTSSDVPTQTLARKRRKEILASQKVSKRYRFLGNEEGEKRDDGLSSSEHIIPKKNTSSSKASCRTKNKVTCKAKVIISNTKYQNRYEPEVQMSKEEEAEWRREARRQRNRESAANSRNKVRNRIHELEKEVEDWKEKYASLLKRIDLLEKKSALASKTIDVPSCVSTCSEEHHDLSVPLVPSCISSNDVLSSTEQQRQSVSQQIVTNDEDHHVIEIKSRPVVSKQ